MLTKPVPKRRARGGIFGEAALSTPFRDCLADVDRAFEFLGFTANLRIRLKLAAIIDHIDSGPSDRFNI